jgi:predicted unusual protein kinase regulating ubiquinone biosynthesis (AarF/ABC1/UbiB family)
MNPERVEKIERAVESGLQRWRESAAADAARVSPHGAAETGVVRPMGRRQPSHDVDTTHVILPMARRVVFKPGIFRPFSRLALWLWICVRYFTANGVDRLLRRASVQRRAVRLRELFEDAGPSGAKLAQQLSLRADILPYAYTAELSKVLDRARPFPTDQAIAIIERSLGRPLYDMFASFDPDPIGSASLACVWQATLKTGERVAVKVRRPGVGPQLAADLRALDWILISAEGLTLIRPGMTFQFRRDLKTMLIAELNFRMEARFTEMFRLQAEKDGDGVTAPKVFFEFCTDEVLVDELVSGYWMWELIAAVDSNDREFLDHLKGQGIEPGLVARRLVRTVHRELLEHPFFHADPHPANLVILPNSRICFIDFGAVGRFSTETRNTWRELQYHMRNRDVGRMVNCSINLAGRLPPIDVDEVMKALDDIYADWVYAVSSTDAEWWERSTAQNWLRYINVAQEYGIPVSLETIRFFRATFLYDSVIVRLDKTIDPIVEWDVYARIAGKDARKRVIKSMKKRFNGPTKMDYLKIEQLGDIINQAAFKFQRRVEDPIVNFRNIVGKIAYSFSVLLRLGYLGILIGGVFLGADILAERLFGRQIAWSEVVSILANAGWLQIIVLLIGLIVIRRILIRLNEPDRKIDSGR